MLQRYIGHQSKYCGACLTTVQQTTWCRRLKVEVTALCNCEVTCAALKSGAAAPAQNSGDCHCMFAAATSKDTNSAESSEEFKDNLLLKGDSFETTSACHPGMSRQAGVLAGERLEFCCETLFTHLLSEWASKSASAMPQSMDPGTQHCCRSHL